MATSSVPGSDAANADKLEIGNWAESSNGDGSYIMVLGLENGRVIYDVYDTSGDRVIFFRHAMSETQFKRRFSSAGWSWHDKHAFPWEVLMAKGARPGVHSISADDLLDEADAIRDTITRLADTDTVPGADDPVDSSDDPAVDSEARRVARELGLRARRLDRFSTGRFRRALGHLRDGIQAAMDELAP